MHISLPKLIIFILLSSINLSAQENMEFEKLNSNNGLSSEEIRDVFQDSNGYLWFLTTEGLNRYDGYEVTILKPGAEGLNFSTASFECICEDSQNWLWLGTTKKGLLIFDKNTHEVVRFEVLSKGKLINDLHIRSLLSDSKNNIWIGTEYGLYSFNINSNEFRFFNLGDLEISDPAWCIIEDIIEDSKGRIWVATWNMGLFIYDPISGQISNFNLFDASSATTNANRIKSLFEDKDQKTWIGTWEDGLYRTNFVDGTLEIESTYLYNDNNQQTISGDIVYTINQDNNNNMWIGTPYGLTIVEHSGGSSPRFHRFAYDTQNEKGLSNNEVWKIYKDHSGLMWIGTLEGGVNKVQPNGKIFDGYTIPPISTQIQSQTVKSFCFDPSRNLLVGVKSLGFGMYDLVEQKYHHYTTLEGYNNLPANLNSVNCSLLEDNRFLWLGTRYNGLIVYDCLSSDYYQANEFNDAFTYEPVNVLVQGKDNVIWVGTEGGLFSVQRCDSTTGCFYINKINGLSGDNIVSIMEDNKKHLWVGTAENGINELLVRENQIKNLNTFSTARNNIPTDGIHCLYKDSENNIWAGSADKSLLLFNQNSQMFTQLEIFKSSKSDAIFSIIEDNDKSLWLTTNDGLTRLIFQNDEIVADNYTVSDGLQGNIFVPRSAFSDQNRIFVGGYYGFNTFNPSEVKPNSFTPQTSITEILINNEPLYYNFEKEEAVALKHNQNNLLIRFSAMSYFKPGKNMFSYKLDGYDASWRFVDAGQRLAQYANLKTGAYTFKVKSANSSGLWNETPQTITFRFLPAPWFTWWAYMGYVCVISLLLVMVYRYLLSFERIKRKLEIQEIEHAKTEKLNQFKLKFFTNISHELLTPLSIMHCALEIIKTRSRKNKDEIGILDRNVHKLNRLLQQLLDFRKIETGHLKLSIRKGDFQSCVEGVTNNFLPLARKKNLKLFFIEEGTVNDSFFDPDKIEKILHNIISNALKYTPTGGSVLVKSSLVKNTDEQWAELSISDTGVGIAKDKLENIYNRFYRADLEKGQTGFGIGLAVTRRLVEIHKGKIEVASVVNKGTTFKLRIPLSEEFYSKDEISLTQPEPTFFEEEEASDVKIIVQKKDAAKSNTKLKLLLVDDNPDFRVVLKAYFSDRFTIDEAEDGRQALKIAIRSFPDIIVSDVMMPNMNGYDLCTELKNNVDTKFIPVILLTAKTATEEQSKGYKVGADSYITKPVSFQLLESRINALLLKRHEYMPFEKVQIVPQPRFPKLTSEELISNVEAFIHQHLSDPELSVSDLCDHLGMSKSMVYRKVKQASNLSPIELIKKIRINSAASLLKNGLMNISEVAYTTGFSDQSYFTLCFKKSFGQTPSEYMVGNKN